MTNREFYEAIKANEDISESLRKHAQDELAKIDARNKSRASKPKKNQQENDSIKEKIEQLLSNCDEMLTTDIATAIGVSTQKITGLCVQLEKEDRITRKEVKVKGKGKCIQWSIVKQTDIDIDKEKEE